MPGVANNKSTASSGGGGKSQCPKVKSGRVPAEKRAVGGVSTVSLAAAARCPNRSAGRGVSRDITCVEETLDAEVCRLRRRKELLQKGIEDALAEEASSIEKHIEVVGSTSWDGDVPQSDLDLVLFTCCEKNEEPDAVALLEELRVSLVKHTEALGIKRLELLAEPRVPILRMSDSLGLSCDVSVNQHRTLRHRDFLRKALEGRPQVRSMIRLVKHWVRRRALPMAAEGGLPSLAWAILALDLANEQPEGTTVEVLLLHFFSQLQNLGEQWLTVTHDAETGEPTFGWQRRAGPNPWAEEWVQLFWLEDPTMVGRGRADAILPASTSDRVPPGIGLTPPSIPAALGVLYIAELRLAWRAIREGLWDELWRPTPPEVRSPLPSYLNPNPRQAPLQILLKDGIVQLAQLVEVRKCPNHQQDSALHRRDQSSELVLQPCSLVKEASGSPRVEIKGDAEKLHFQPCHWICALPTWNQKVIEGDGLSRLGEIASLPVVVADVADDLNLWEAANPGQRQPKFPNRAGGGGHVGEQAIMHIQICQMTGLAWVPWPGPLQNVDTSRKSYGGGLRAPYPVGPTNFVHVGASRYARHPWNMQQAPGNWKNGQADDQPSHRRKKGDKVDKGEAVASDARACGSTAGKVDDDKPERSAAEHADERLLTALRVAMPSENVPRSNEALSSDAPGRSDYCPMKAHSDESTRASDSDVDDAQRTDADDRLHLRDSNGIDQKEPDPDVAPTISDMVNVPPSSDATLSGVPDDRVVELKGGCDSSTLIQDTANLDLVHSEGSDQTARASAYKDSRAQDVSGEKRCKAKEWSLSSPGLLLALNLDAPRWCV